MEITDFNHARQIFDVRFRSIKLVRADFLLNLEKIWTPNCFLINMAVVEIITREIIIPYVSFFYSNLFPNLLCFYI